jgi:NADH-quinone oxidoreductase subunit H
LLMSSLFVIFFFGGNSTFSLLEYSTWFSLGCLASSIVEIFFFSFKVIITTFMFIFVRANLPRFRFDQLMFIGWKIFLPLTLGFVLFFTGFLFSINSLDINQFPEINCRSNYISSFSTRF